MLWITVCVATRRRSAQTVCPTVIQNSIIVETTLAAKSCAGIGNASPIALCLAAPLSFPWCSRSFRAPAFFAVCLHRDGKMSGGANPAGPRRRFVADSWLRHRAAASAPKAYTLPTFALLKKTLRLRNLRAGPSILKVASSGSDADELPTITRTVPGSTTRFIFWS